VAGVAWAISGGLLALCGLRLSERLGRAIIRELSQQGRPFPVWGYFVAALVGLVTGWRAGSGETVREIVSLFLVASLLVIQAPLDASIHRLSRPVTMVSLACVLVAGAMDGIANQRVSGALLGIAMASGVCGIYALIHAISPRLIGWGDVLLILPLAIALAPLGLGTVLTWQFFASLTGSLHAVSLRLTAGVRSIPFGPHLLAGAWLVLVFSL
jgi:leader peptidase (prepilin peptidase)/N-methyltransferase